MEHTTARSRERWLIAGLIAGAVVTGGCSQDPVDCGCAPAPEPPPIVWNQLRGGLGVGEIRSVHGVSAQRVFAVHPRGVLAFDGFAWRAETLPGTLPELNAVWAASADDVFAVGNEGLILRRTGSGWSEMSNPSPTRFDIVAIHGNSPEDVYVVSATGETPGATQLLHYDGSAWRRLYARIGADANAVGSVPGFAFVVCDSGVVFRYDGTTVHEDNTLVKQDLLGVCAISANDAFLVGENGRIMRWNGTIWVPMASGVNVTLRAVTARAANDVVAVGDEGVVLHFDGTSWTSGNTGTYAPLRSVCVFDGGRSMAVGDLGTVVTGFGVEWVPRNDGQPFAFESVWSSNGYFIAVGSGPDGGVIRDRYGNGWSFAGGMHAIAGAAYLVFAAGDNGAIYRYDGEAYPMVWRPETSPTSENLRGMSGLVSRFGEPFRVYAVGDNGTLLVWKGGAWSLAVPPAGAENHQFVDVWAAAIDDVFAVAGNATSVARYDDPYELADWTLEDTPASAPLLAVTGWRGATYIASEAGEIFSNDGTGWKPMAHPVNTPIRDMRTLSENSIFAAGDAGIILHFDGIRWARTDSRFAGDLLGIWGSETSSTNLSVFAVGADGAVLLHKD